MHFELRYMLPKILDRELLVHQDHGVQCHLGAPKWEGHTLTQHIIRDSDGLELFGGTETPAIMMPTGRPEFMEDAEPS